VPTGLDLPVGVNAQGGARLVSKDTQAMKIIALSLSDLENDNAFQQNIGLNGAHVFDIAGASFRASVRQRIFDIFRDFEDLKLYSLNRGTMKFSRTAAGEQTLEFEFVNLESDEPINFIQKFTTKGR
jgi:hypothetical protein